MDYWAVLFCAGLLLKAALSGTSSQALGTSCKVVSWLSGGYWLWERKDKIKGICYFTLRAMRKELTGKGRAVNSSGQHLRSCKGAFLRALGFSAAPVGLGETCISKMETQKAISVASNFKLLVGSEVWGGAVQCQMEVF